MTISRFPVPHLFYSSLLLSLLCVPGIRAKALTVVTEVSPPHQVIVNGELAGVSTKLVKAILKQSGNTATFNAYPWTRAFDVASRGPDILLYNVARTSEREALFHWIGPVARYQFGFVAMASNQHIEITSLQDARAYSIASQRGDVSTEWLLKQGFGQNGSSLIQTADILESWHLLQHGKVELVIDDKVSIGVMPDSIGPYAKPVRMIYLLPELAIDAWLVASKETSEGTVERLRQAYQQTATTELYKKVMNSDFSEIIDK